MSATMEAWNGEDAPTLILSSPCQKRSRWRSWRNEAPRELRLEASASIYYILPAPAKFFATARSQTNECDLWYISRGPPRGGRFHHAARLPGEHPFHVGHDRRTCRGAYEARRLKGLHNSERYLMDVQAYFEEWSRLPGETVRMAISTKHKSVRATLERITRGPSNEDSGNASRSFGVPIPD